MTLLRPVSHLAPFARTYGFAVALAVVLLYLVFRNTGIYPMVFADEWLYSKAARLAPLSESILPSYLYLALFRTTNACGPGFLDCARVLNAVLLVASAPLIYLIAARVCERRIAMLVALASLLAPLNAFSAYFMPEAMYFFAFYVLTWAALGYKDAAPLRYGLLTGSLLGLATAVKVHALFLLPALLAFMVYLNVAGHRGRGWVPRALTMMLAAVLSMVLVKSAVGYLLAGPAGLHFLGQFYGAHADHSAAGLSLAPLLREAFTSLRGHLLALVLLMGLPLAALALHLASAATRAASPAPLRQLQVYALLMLGAAGALTVAFTASLAVRDPQEVLRMHLRYYDFVFPLLLIGAAATLTAAEHAVPLAKRLAIGLGLAALSVAAMRLLPTQFNPIFTDGPELAVLLKSPAALRNLVALQVLVLLVWIWRRRLAAKLFLFVLLPLTILASERQARIVFDGARLPGAYDNAGLLTRQYLGKPDGARLAVGGEGAGLARAMFHIDQAATTLVDLEPGAPIAREELTPRHDWMLVVGKHALPAGMRAEIATGQFALLRIDAPHQLLVRADLGKPLGGGALASVEGLHWPEPWGAWSSGKVVTLRFAAALPSRLSIVLRANAFGPNAGQDFVLAVGEQRKAFRLAGAAQDRYFQFDTGGGERTLTIEVPQPVSPTSLGLGRDDRLLGIALWSVEIGQRP